MTNIIRQFVKDVECKTKQRDIIAVGKAMALHCDERIARARTKLAKLADVIGDRKVAATIRRHARTL